MTLAPSAVDQNLADLASQVLSVESDVVHAEKRTAEMAKINDRSMIAKWIIRGFVIIVGIFLLCVIGGVVGRYLWPDRMVNWQEGAGLIKDLLSSVLLPVVTLVIGFYFGAEKTS